MAYSWGETAADTGFVVTVNITVGGEIKFTNSENIIQSISRD